MYIYIKMYCMENDKRILTELDRSKQMMGYTTKPKKKVDQKLKTPEEIITAGNIVTLKEFVENKKGDI